MTSTITTSTDDTEMNFGPNDKRTVSLVSGGEEAQANFLSKLTKDERRALNDFKAENEELCSGWNDSFLMKFVWARKLDIKRASELFEAHLAWRKEWDLDHMNMEGIRTFLKSGLSWWVPGLYTRDGYGVSFIMPRNLRLQDWKDVGSQGLIHGVYYMTDLAGDHDIEIARQGTVLVEDLSGASFSDLLSILKGDAELDLTKLIDSAQNHMPSRIRDVILLNPPWYVRMLLGIVKPLLKPNLRKKIHTVKSSELEQYFTPENLLESFGGTRKFDMDAWAEKILATRPQASEGDFVDPSERSEDTIQSYAGTPKRSKKSPNKVKYTEDAHHRVKVQAGQ